MQGGCEREEDEERGKEIRREWEITATVENADLQQCSVLSVA